MTPNSLRTEDILSYPVVKDNIGICIDQIVDWIDQGDKSRYFVCANPHSLHVAKDDPAFQLALLNADLITPDGVGIVIASKLLDGGIKTRITGSDIFLGLSSLLNNGRKRRYFFLGSTEETLSQIEANMKLEFPNITVAGAYSPPFKQKFSAYDNKKMVDAINSASPDVLWVGMTAPKQEKWIYENKDMLNVKFIGAIGAVFDFFTGRVKRSSPIFQRLGLEWLPRLLQEPGRLWKRNFVSNPSFLLRVLGQKLTK